MADASRRTAAPKQGSYKTKLLQPSATDELHARDQEATKMKLPPSKDAGAPASTLGVAEAPAGPGGMAGPIEGTDTADAPTKPQNIKKTGGGAASSGPNKSWAPDGSTQSAVDARHKFSGDRQGSSADEDYHLPEGSTVVAQPTHVDDRDAGGDDGAAAGPNKSWAPDGSTQSAVDARHKFCGDRQGSSADEDYQLPQGSTVVAQPQHVDEPCSDDSSAGLPVKTGQTTGKMEPVNDGSKSQNPLTAAAATVASTAAAAAKPVAAVVGQLKSVVAGSGFENIEGDEGEQEEESEGLKIAISEYVETEGGDKVLAAAVL